jgi:hypothetical protein
MERQIGKFGTIWAEFSGKPKQAIEHLLKVQEGEVPSAIFTEEMKNKKMISNNESPNGTISDNIKGETTTSPESNFCTPTSAITYQIFKNTIIFGI